MFRLIQKKIVYFSFFLYSCSTLVPSEYVLYKQAIKGNKDIPSADLEALYRQRINRKLYKFMPYASIYERSKQKLEKKRIKDSTIKAEYSESINKNPSNVKVLQKEMEKKLRKNAYIDYRIESTQAKYDTALLRAYNKNRERKFFKIKKKKEKKMNALFEEKEKGNFWMRVVGEPYSIYNPENTEKTRKEMEKYLFSKGYFAGKVSVSVDSAKPLLSKNTLKTVNITYNINEGLAHKIDSLYYITDNPVIDSLIKSSESLVKIGKNIERNNLEAERNRIESLLLENGFYRFDKQYIIIQIDTTIDKTEEIFMGRDADTDLKVRAFNISHVRYIINNPQKKDTAFISQNTIGNAVAQIYLDNILGQHIQYKIKKISFFIKEEEDKVLDTTNISFYPIENPIRFFYGKRKYSQKILSNKILIKPSDFYKKANFDKTNQNLASLNLFKFRSLQTQDNRRGDLDVSIIATPYEKFSNINDIGMSVSQNIPGPFFNTSLGIRNIFGGCGILENNFLFSIDGQASFIDAGSVYRTTQVSFNTSYIAPLLLFPGKWTQKAAINRLNPTTRLSAGVSFVARPEYGRRNFNLSLSYNFFKFPHKTFSFSPIDLNIINTYRIDADFEQLLSDFSLQGNNLALSFRNALITGTKLYYEYNSINHRENTFQKYWRPSAEFGGTILNLFNQEYLNENKFLGLEYFKFLRFSNEIRLYQPLSKRKPTKMVYRLFAGMAIPYGQSEILPYEKFFFSGGNTMRAWVQRRLGPGGYQAPDSLSNVERQGNIILEANTELRFRVWSFINMGLFVDIGNIWTLRDNGLENSVFKSNFYEQLAVAAGAGFRFDFSFLLLRLDLGLRVLDPSLPTNERFVLPNVKLKNLLGGSSSATLNIGIGYPF
ncbi:MAG: BamA/TamA family outer membrane protein [Thermonemataceae bacterium]|nr:BamA/TamA family outer membrane protein [Thermonemataceae bacterium]